ncbi:MAG: COX15/CtaA family protein [Endozoicomonas sp. (ex Botrylloides leachii)]|nr:COX15/CtaA family protein [Endozoicomonas sp. (ex Botrylloides leachii)]
MEHKNKYKYKKGYYLAVVSTLLAVIVVGLGAYTRLVHAGLSCPDWPGCYGFLTVPQTEKAIEIAQSRFPDVPVEIFKGWAEMVHRYLAGLLMLLVLILAVQSFRFRHTEGQPKKLPFFILGIICLQAVFGMWTVTLKLWPQVVTGHLIGGFATLALLFLLTLRLSGFDWRILPITLPLKRLKKLSSLGLALVIVQITLGGWTSANYAALACPDFPICQGKWLPPVDFKKGFDIGQQIGPNYLGGVMDSASRMAIHLSHRVGAIVVFLVLLMMLFAARIYAKDLAKEDKKGLYRLSWFVLIALLLQLFLGIGNVIWHLPLSIAVAHNLGGALLLLSMVAFNYRISSFMGRDVQRG